MSIRSKLILAIIAILALIAPFGVFAVFSVMRTGQVAVETFDKPLMAINFARTAQNDFERMLFQAARALAAGSGATPAGLDAALSRNFQEDLDIARERSLSDEAKRTVATLERDYKSWNATRQDIAATGLWSDAFDQLTQTLRDGFELLAEQAAGDGFRFRVQAAQAGAEAENALLAVFGALLLCLGAIFAWLWYGIAQPLRASVAVANRIAGGDLEADIPAGRHETGVLLQALSVMQGKIRTMLQQEIALRQTAQLHLRAAIASIEEGFVLFGPDDRIVLANDCVARLLPEFIDLFAPGASFAETMDGMVARLRASGVREIDDDAVGAWLERHRAAPYIVEQSLGRGRWMRFSESRMEQGGAVMVVTDITELKRRERQLARQAALLESTVESIEQGILVLDPRRNILLANRRFHVLVNAPEGTAAIGRPLATLLAGLEAQGIYGADEIAGLFGEPRESTSAVHSFERRQPDGRTLMVNIGPMPGGGRVYVFTDVTEHRRAERTIRRERRLLRTIIDAVPAMIHLKDRALRYQFVNSFVADFRGIAPDEAIGRTAGELIAAGHAEPSDARDRRIVETAEAVPFYEERLSGAGGARDFWTTKLPLIDEDSQVSNVLTVALDITERKRAEAKQRESEEQYRHLVEGSLQGILVHRGDKPLFCNQAFADIFGLESSEAVRALADVWELVAPEEHARLAEMTERRLRGEAAPNHYEYVGMRPNGERIWLDNRITLLDWEGAPASLVTVIDITERKRYEEQLVHDAFHDKLTGLANRALFLDRLDQALRRAEQGVAPRFAVLFLDLDRFKLVNDSYGHSAGDKLLVSVAQRLAQCLRPIDTLARFGGDEFTILLENLRDDDEATAIAARIKDDLDRPFTLDGREVFATASIGIASGSASTARPADLLSDADLAMYRAKELGKARYERFEAKLRQRAVSELQVGTDLRRALEQGQIHLHYQPIFHIADMRVAGFEALLRWYHPTRGMISPVEFIPVTEDTGLIVPIGAYVLTEARRQLMAWRAEIGPAADDLTMAVNLSVRQLRDPEHIAVLQRLIELGGLPPGALKLEVTESAIIDDTTGIAERLHALKACGVQLSLDDFGTGYSSLSYLHALPFDILKIDRSFIRRMNDGARNFNVVRAIVDLAHDLGMTVVAEGVERSAEIDMLRRLGCEFGQGYLFSPPLPAGKATELLTKSWVA
ncbi:MAG: EAL domain-containing protein [Proteobacteria bacterium]|nr:EAL domain-containing protein [Pseudomonadota bacterium]